MFIMNFNSKINIICKMSIFLVLKYIRSVLTTIKSWRTFNHNDIDELNIQLRSNEALFYSTIYRNGFTLEKWSKLFVYCLFMKVYCYPTLLFSALNVIVHEENDPRFPLLGT